jgi:uncharacterized membrane protein YedE/YeeE
MIGFWPWWIAAPTLSGMALLFWWRIGRPLGVSGSLARALGWREERAADATAVGADDEALAAAMLAATREEFGDAAVAAGPPPPARAAVVPSRAASLPWTAHLTLLAGLAGGGLLSTAIHGGVHARASLGPAFEHLFGGGALGLALLFGGGLLVGAGTAMAGGCTSGHGLNGCSRLQRGSLLATAAFFGTAVGLSLLVGAVR